MLSCNLSAVFLNSLSLVVPLNSQWVTQICCVPEIIVFPFEKHICRIYSFKDYNCSQLFSHDAMSVFKNTEGFWLC